MTARLEKGRGKKNPVPALWKLSLASPVRSLPRKLGVEESQWKCELASGKGLL